MCSSIRGRGQEHLAALGPAPAGLSRQRSASRTQRRGSGAPRGDTPTRDRYSPPLPPPGAASRRWACSKAGSWNVTAPRGVRLPAGQGRAGRLPARDNAGACQSVLQGGGKLCLAVVCQEELPGEALPRLVGVPGQGGQHQPIPEEGPGRPPAGQRQKGLGLRWESIMPTKAGALAGEVLELQQGDAGHLVGVHGGPPPRPGSQCGRARRWPLHTASTQAPGPAGAPSPG